jgi:hypothetical protein
MNQVRGVRGWWYSVALVPFAIGIALFVHQVVGLIEAVDDMPRVVVPGQGDVVLAAGSHLIFGETESVYGGTAYVASELSLRCTVVDATSGGGVPLAAPSGSAEYTVGGHSGRSMFEFTAPHEGRYHIDCDGTGGPTTIAFGGALLGAALALFASLGGGIFGASVVWGVVFLLRRRRCAARVLPYPEVVK